MTVDSSRASRPLTHRLRFRILLVAALFIPPWVVPGEPVETPLVFQAVLQASPLANYPAVALLAKLVLVIVAALPFFDVRSSARTLLAYYAVLLAVTSTVNTMLAADEFGFVWLAGTTAIQLVVAGWCVVDVVLRRSTITAGSLRRGRLWLLAPMTVAWLMPYVEVGGDPVPSLATVLWNEGGVTYATVTPIVLGVLLLFPNDIDHRTLSLASFAGLVLGISSAAVWLLVSPANWWMVVLHVPLLVTAAFGFWESRDPRDSERIDLRAPPQA